MLNLELPFSTSGSLLLDADWQAAPGLIIALHGYTDTAARIATALRPLANVTGWALACPEANHHFYHNRVPVASWMTSHRRPEMIATNDRWLSAVLAHLRTGSQAPIVVVGFSQGASQAWRIAWKTTELAGVVAIAGDIPPEYQQGPAPTQRIPALLVRGNDDHRYSAARLKQDQSTLKSHHWPHEILIVPGRHAVDEKMCQEIGSWLCRA